MGKTGSKAVHMAVGSSKMKIGHFSVHLPEGMGQRIEKPSILFACSPLGKLCLFNSGHQKVLIP
ncbi:hypothetical protein ACQ0QQ_13830 [Lysinibacillus sphaericus]